MAFNKSGINSMPKNSILRLAGTPIEDVNTFIPELIPPARYLDCLDVSDYLRNGSSINQPSAVGLHDWRLLLTPNSWTSSDPWIISHWRANSPTNNSWMIEGNGTGGMKFSKSDGTTISTSTSIDMGFVDGETRGIRVTYETTTGDVNFYISYYEDISDDTKWVQLGSTDTIASGIPKVSVVYTYIGNTYNPSSNGSICRYYNFIYTQAGAASMNWDAAVHPLGTAAFVQGGDSWQPFSGAAIAGV